MELPQSYNSFRELDQYHHHIDSSFRSFQIFLMHNKYKQAKLELKRLEILLSRHIKDEEALLLPLYKKLINPLPKGGALEFYRREHEQISGYVKRFLQTIQDWNIETPPAELELVKLFDACYEFKHLVDHHDTREDTFLYRLLDQKTPEKKRKTILAAMLNGQQTALEACNAVT